MFLSLSTISRRQPLHHIVIILLAFSASAWSVQAYAKSPKKNDAKSRAPHTVTNNSVTVYAAGDIADCGKLAPAATMAASTANVVEQALDADKKAYAITLGDNSYPVGKLEEFNECYQPTWGKFKERTMPSPGNHEYGTPSAMGYYNYFGELAGPDRRGYYRSKVGTWQVYSLNSNIKGEQMQEQLAWLKEELAANPKQCTLAFWHHPVFTSGGHGNNKVMLEAWKLLEAANADIVLAGHDHDYERLAPTKSDGNVDKKNGIRSFVVGTGGAELTPMFFPKPQTEVRTNSSFGVLKLVLHEKRYEWEFIAIDKNGVSDKFNDKGEEACH